MKKLYVILFLIALFIEVNAQNQDGLLAYYPLNGNGLDLGGLNNHGTVSSVTPVSDRFNHPNKAMFFNGYSSNIEVNNQFPDLSELTICFWFKLKADAAAGVNANRTYIFWEGDAICGHDIAVGFSGNKIFVIGDKVGGQLNGITGTAEVNLLNESPAINGWFFFSWTMTSNMSKLYLNGVLKSSIALLGSGIGYHYNPTIGCLNDGNRAPCGTPKNSFFEGSIDDLKIYSKAKTSSQISAYFQSGLSSNSSGILSQASQQDFLVYPNPVNGNEMIIVAGSSQSMVSNIFVSDLNGKNIDVAKRKTNGGNWEVNLNQFPTGVYFIEIFYMENETELKTTKKIIKLY